MRIKLSPQVSLDQVEYYINQEGILKIVNAETVVYIDTNSVKQDTFVTPHDYILSATYVDNELQLELLNFITDDATDAERESQIVEMATTAFKLEGEALMFEAPIVVDHELTVDSAVHVLQQQVEALSEQLDMRDDLIQEMAMKLYE